MPTLSEKIEKDAKRIFFNCNVIMLNKMISTKVFLLILKLTNGKKFEIEDLKSTIQKAFSNTK
jgi:hypothetical protein